MNFLEFMGALFIAILAVAAILHIGGVFGVRFTLEDKE